MFASAYLFLICLQINKTISLLHYCGCILIYITISDTRYSFTGNKSLTPHQLMDWQTLLRHKTFKQWRVLGKHFYELSNQEEGHVFTLSIQEFVAKAHSTQACGAQLAVTCAYIILYSNISSSVFACWFGRHILSITCFITREAGLESKHWTTVEEKLKLCSLYIPHFSCVGARASLCV